MAKMTESEIQECNRQMAAGTYVAPVEAKPEPAPAKESAKKAASKVPVKEATKGE